MTQTVLYLAGSEDLEHERQTMSDELLGVLFFLDAAKLFQKTLDQRSAVLMETCPQRLHPSVQSPWDPWEIVTDVNTFETYTHRKIEHTACHTVQNTCSCFRDTNRGSVCLW